MKVNALQKKILLLLAVCDFILIVMFALSFVFKSKGNSIKTKETVLLNATSLESMSAIVMTDSVEGQVVTLSRGGSFWTGKDSATETTWPADPQTVRNLVDTLLQVRMVRIKAESDSAWEDLGLDEESAFSIKILGENSKELLTLYFGRIDTLSQRIAFRTSNDSKSYETDFSLRSYLNADASFWADPFFFPVFLSGSASVNMQSSYRHGVMLPLLPLPEEPVKVLKKTFENGSRAVYSVYENEDEFIIFPQFYASQSMSQIEQEAVRKCNYRYSLSQWTYQRILEDWKDE
ncbi:MAG: DUF4340 domain-containing protein [Treponema sp.]|nr:DUF4340 domain-containing protein [Treponema sp.]